MCGAAARGRHCCHQLKGRRGAEATLVQQEAMPLLALHSEGAERDFISFAHGGVSGFPCNIRREGG